MTPSALKPDSLTTPAGRGRVSYRLRQGLAHLAARPSAEVDAALRAALPPEQFALVARLSPADRAHHLAVARWVSERSADEDLARAALLHDVGKVDGRAQVRLPQRTLSVLLGAAAPRLLRSLARPSSYGWRHGLYLTRAHPVVGAELARLAGASERVCWLIAHHHDASTTDRALRMLQRADEEA